MNVYFVKMVDINKIKELHWGQHLKIIKIIKIR